MAQRDATVLDQASIKPSIITRQVSLGDLPSLPPIFNHSITTSVVSFRLSPVGVDLFEDVLKTTYTSHLPFIVATTLAPPPPVEGNREIEPGVAVVEKVIGYAYAVPWRPNYPAYKHTVEMSIYVHPDYQSVGAGTALMYTVMDALRATRLPEPTTAPNALVGDGTGDSSDGMGRVHQVLAITALDTKGRDGGFGIEKFYSRWGFERVGHMKRVGYKFDRWVDVLILQASL